ncbi:methylated-DNA--cysteine S-met [Mycena vitilis]|nr:methylated-DNA--cysteine S-met [Mycena vitilis]
MPATRTEKFSVPSLKYTAPSSPLDKGIDGAMYYPATTGLRSQFRTQTGKRVTPHQWSVYDFTLTIPAGKVATYKDVCQAVGGSPRSVGGALRNNPFAPFVPCHRVIASSLFIGGFVGEWGKEHKTGTQYHRKLALLAKEGVAFTEGGRLESRELLWKEFAAQ